MALYYPQFQKHTKKLQLNGSFTGRVAEALHKSSDAGVDLLTGIVGNLRDRSQNLRHRRLGHLRSGIKIRRAYKATWREIRWEENLLLVERQRRHRRQVRRDEPGGRRKRLRRILQQSLHAQHRRNWDDRLRARILLLGLFLVIEDVLGGLVVYVARVCVGLLEEQNLVRRQVVHCGGEHQRC